VVAAEHDRRAAAGQPAHVHGRGSVGDGRVADLPVVVVTPALGAAARGEGAGVFAACEDARNAAGQSAHIGWSLARAGRAIAHLPVGIVAPAFGAAARGERAGVSRACRNGGDAARQPAHIGRRGAREQGAIAQLSLRITAPALHASARGQRAGVIAAHRNGFDSAGESAHACPERSCCFSRRSRRVERLASIGLDLLDQVYPEPVEILPYFANENFLTCRSIRN